MSDVIKEIINKTYTSSDVNVSKEIAMFSTDANTQYVIKDVQVNVSTVSGEVQINNFPVGGIYSMSGSEIVDTNSDVKLKITNNFNLGKDNYVEAFFLEENVLYKKIFNETEVPILPLPVISEGQVAVLTMGSVNNYGNISFIYKALDGDIFVGTTDGNSQQGLYKYNGITFQDIKTASGLGGTYTPLCFDGNHTVYYCNASSIFAYNLDTETKTAIGSIGIGLSSSYPYIMHSNGFLFASFDAYSGSVYYMNIANPSIKGSFQALNGSGMAENGMQYCFPSIFHDSSDDTYYITALMPGNSRIIYKSLSNAALLTSSARMTWTLVKTITGVGRMQANGRAFGLDDTGYFYFNDLSNTILRTNYRTGDTVSYLGDKNLTNKILTPTRRVIANAMSDYNIQVKVRITGIETKI